MVPAELVARIEAALGVQFAVVFGQTEASGFISQTRLDDTAEDKGATLGIAPPRCRGARGRPRHRCAGASGRGGELEVRGPNVMAGYHELPGETAAAIGPDGWLRTGDLVTMDDRGYLRMSGRRKEMIVSGGENIFPVEIENGLLEHPDVAQAAVLGVPDDRWGEAAVAVVVPDAGSRPGPWRSRGFSPRSDGGVQGAPSLRPHRRPPPDRVGQGPEARGPCPSRGPTRGPPGGGHVGR